MDANISTLSASLRMKDKPIEGASFHEQKLQGSYSSNRRKINHDMPFYKYSQQDAFHINSIAPQHAILKSRFRQLMLGDGNTMLIT
jgi:hypothetical protein